MVVFSSFRNGPQMVVSGFSSARAPACEQCGPGKQLIPDLLDALPTISAWSSQHCEESRVRNVEGTVPIF
jgi:hypothetical protein